jgi:hemerythrin
MPDISWSPALSVGVEELDLQHQNLVGLINEFHRARSEGRGREVLGAMLTSLVDYARVHFELEERLMLEHGYPDLEAHKREHEHFTHKVQRLKASYDAGAPALVGETDVFLATWLSHHVREVDKGYVPYLTGDNPK